MTFVLERPETPKAESATQAKMGGEVMRGLAAKLTPRAVLEIGPRLVDRTQIEDVEHATRSRSWLPRCSRGLCDS